MRSSSNKNEGRVQEISEITQGLKALAKGELSVPVLAFRNYLELLSKEMINNPNWLI